MPTMHITCPTRHNIISENHRSFTLSLINSLSYFLSHTTIILLGINQPTNSIELRPSSKATSHWTTEEFPNIFPNIIWYVKVHYCVYKSPSLVPNPKPAESSPNLPTLFL
jgi:hypothetical protein